MNKALLNRLEHELGTTVKSVSGLSGGDINEAFLLQTSSTSFFVKSNTYTSGLQMFETEAKGLDIIGNTRKVKTPEVISWGAVDQFNYLILEYVTSKHPGHRSWELFGKSLAKLHQVSQERFGLDHSNFIGPLLQSNKHSSSWDSFYINERLQPQINLAKSNNAIDHATLSSFETLYEKLKDLCPIEPPALIHGDLWNGNFLIDTNNQPVLIDPAVSYAHREMDIAMTYLFGGFSELFYQSYQEVYPLEKGIEHRVGIYQLYYLMVHVNLFGGSYLQSVKRILNNYV